MERLFIARRSTLQALSHGLGRFCLPLSRATAQLMRWRQLSRNRAEMARLSDDCLRDIGLSRADIILESSRRFWDDPLKG
ncbi:hypothetical protein PS862_01046 [Pseudomonas fluorescens]|uniref:YjiS-like domain-containing protein n=1 Tax=Pseudomonas fluorescens TaxID=294 RepID=A0A5E7HM96_PSEFL|nr:DUF1127 domain-containing protein [Pseudomonas fluorescens]VVN17360.1 hypothetical protein PS639_04107 [Pseudomonas fluorescens]VVO65334.1 hypothetical protein PS862_01046 [Pseudomonas fluorescens]